MTRFVCLVALLSAGLSVAAPVPKEKPDPLPDGALVRLGSARFRGPHVGRVVFSADGKTLLGTDNRGTVVRWEADTGRPIAPVKTDLKDVVSSWVVAGRVFVASNAKPDSRDSPTRVHVIDLPAATERSWFEVRANINTTHDADLLGGNTYRVEGVVISADGKRFAIDEWMNDTKRWFNADTGRQLDDIPGWWVNLSADAARLRVNAKVGDEWETQVIDTATGKLVCVLEGKGGGALSSDGTRAAGAWQVQGKAGVEYRYGVWDADTGKPLPAPDLKTGVWDQAFLSLDRVVICHEADGGGAMLTAWDVKAGKRLWSTGVFQRRSPPVYDRNGFYEFGWHEFSLAASPDGKRVVVTDGMDRLAVFDATSGKRAGDDPSHPEAVRWVGFSPDGGSVFTATHHDLRAWDADSGQLRSAAEPFADVARTFVGATADHLVWRSFNPEKNQSTVLAWDPATGKEAWRTKGEPNTVGRTVAGGGGVIAPRGQRTGPNVVDVFDREGKKRPLEVAAPFDPSAPLVPAADRVFAFTALNRERKLTITSWALDTGKKVDECRLAWGEAFALTPNSLTPTADGRAVAVTTTQTKAPGGWAVVDVAGGKVLHHGSCELPYPIEGAIATDQTKLIIRASGNPVVKVFELKNGGMTWTLDGKGAAATAVAFSPDGTKAVVGYRDGTALIWDVSK